MTNKELDVLKAARPSYPATPHKEDLFDQIVAEHTHREHIPSRFTRRWGRPARIAFGLAVVLTIGVGATWAATKESPIVLIFGHELGESISTGRPDGSSAEFSILHPATEKEIVNLPDEVLMMVQGQQARPVPPPSPVPDDFDASSRRFTLEPATISAIGGTETASGEPVTVLSVNGEICVSWTSWRIGGCETPAEIAKRGMATTGHISDPVTQDAFGLVNDQVKSIRIEGAELPDYEVSDNVFHITGLPDGPFALVGLDQDGKEVLRINRR